MKDAKRTELVLKEDNPFVESSITQVEQSDSMSEPVRFKDQRLMPKKPHAAKMVVQPEYSTDNAHGEFSDDVTPKADKAD